MIAIQKKISPLLVQHMPSCMLILFFFINLFFRWPGNMSPDAKIQLKEATSGIYSDHHPPIMSFLWRILNNIFYGPGIILIFHLLLLYSACYILMRSFQNKNISWYYTLYPLFLPILLYSSMIWKDIGFAFSYLLFMAGLTYFTLHQKKPSSLEFFALFAVLFYGTAVKFQGMYIAPAACLGLSYIMQNFKLNFKTIASSIFLYLALFSSITILNNVIVPEKHKSNSWKFVKIYDLAGMSILLNKPIFPEYIKNYSKFDFNKVKTKFNYERVDDIVFFEDSPIPRIETKQDREELLKLWRVTACKHPMTYLQHRCKNWLRILFAKPFEKLHEMNFEDYGHAGYLAQLQKAAKSFKNRSWEHYLGLATLGSLNIARHALDFIFVFICAILYMLLGLLCQHRLGFLLFVINCIAFMLVLALLPFCMASSLRYVYLSVCLVHASHPIAYLAWKQLRRNKKHSQ